MQEVLTKEEKTEINNYLENLNEIKSKYGSLSFQDFRKQKLKGEAQTAIFNLVCIKIDKLFQKLSLSKLLIEFVNIESDLLNISCKIHNLLDLKQIKSLEKEFNTNGASLYEGESYVSGFYNTSLIGIFGTNFNKNIGKNISIEDFLQEVKNIRNFCPFNGQEADFNAICEQLNSIKLFRLITTYKESSAIAVISSLEKYTELMNEYNKKFNELIEIKNELIYKNVEASSLFLQDLYVLNTYITATKINNDYCVCAESRRCEDILKEFGFYSKDQEKLKENPLLEIIPYAERVLIYLNENIESEVQKSEDLTKVKKGKYHISFSPDNRSFILKINGVEHTFLLAKKKPNPENLGRLKMIVQDKEIALCDLNPPLTGDESIRRFLSTINKPVKEKLGFELLVRKPIKKLFDNEMQTNPGIALT